MKFWTTTLFVISILSFYGQDLKYKEYFPDGTLKLEYEGEKNIPDGLLKFYFPTGELQGELIFEKGLQDGPSKMFYKSGSVEKLMTFKKGIQTDTMKIYFESGGISEVSLISSNGKNGRYVSYFENGQIMVDGNTKDNNLHGRCIHYKENGKKESEGDYSEGVRVGVWMEYNDIGVTQKTYGAAASKSEKEKTLIVFKNKMKLLSDSSALYFDKAFDDLERGVESNIVENKYREPVKALEKQLDILAKKFQQASIDLGFTNSEYEEVFVDLKTYMKPFILSHKRLKSMGVEF
jgi:antitoxin component YwqK of YwqJK toxin-antitoxin module